jgi:hypothetical protein
VSALPLRPFGVPDLVWPPGMCEACYEPQWSDSLRDWEYVEDGVGPCGACQALPTDVARSLDRKDIRARLADHAGYDALFHAVAPGDGERKNSR